MQPLKVKRPTDTQKAGLKTVGEKHTLRYILHNKIPFYVLCMLMFLYVSNKTPQNVHFGYF